MPNVSRWPGWNSSLPELLSRAVGVAWGLAMALLLIVAARDHHPEFTSRLECGTDPQDFLRAGELLDRISLRLIVDAHCSNARYLSDQWIALHYGGGEVDVEIRKLSIGGETYYSIVSVGGDAAP
jgi:hypothetical protein